MIQRAGCRILGN